MLPYSVLVEVGAKCYVINAATTLSSRGYDRMGMIEYVTPLAVVFDENSEIITSPTLQFKKKKLEVNHSFYTEKQVNAFCAVSRCSCSWTCDIKTVEPLGDVCRVSEGPSKRTVARHW